jgi:hypothetical protein
MREHWNRKHGWRDRVVERRNMRDAPAEVSQQAASDIQDEIFEDELYDAHDYRERSSPWYVVAKTPILIDGVVHVVDKWGMYTACVYSELSFEVPEFRSTDEANAWVTEQRALSRNNITCLDCLCQVLCYPTLLDDA